MGKLYSKLYREKPICFELGCNGLLLCCSTFPLILFSCGSTYLCFAGMGCFCLLSNYFRTKIKRLYKVQEEKTKLCCCCGPYLTPSCEYLHFGCNYPCSFFQMFMSVEEWSKENLLSIESSASSTKENFDSTYPIYCYANSSNHS